MSQTEEIKKDKNDVTGEVKKDNFTRKAEQLRDSIIESFNQTVAEKKPIWEMGIVDCSYMNPASGTVYGAMNAAYLNSQMNRRRLEIQIEEYQKSPLLTAKIREIMVNKEDGLFITPYDIIKKLRLAGDENKEVHKELKKADKRIEKHEVSPYFMTYNQLKHIYDHAGAKGYFVLQVFVDQGKKVKNKDEKEEEKEEEEKDLGDIIDDALEGKNKKTFNIGKGKVSSIAVCVYNYSDMKVKPDLEEPEGYKRRMELFQKEVMPAEIKTVMESLINISPFPISRVFGDGSSAFFNETLGVVNVAPSKYYKSDLEEIHDIAHEISHAYGGAANMGMKEYKKYARDCYVNYEPKNFRGKLVHRPEEELVANLSATMLLNMFNLKATEEERMAAYEKNHEVYDHGWASHLKDNIEAVYRATKMADKISKNLFYKVKEDLKLRYAKDPNLALPPYIKDQFDNENNKQKLDSSYKTDFTPKIKDEKTLDTSNMYKKNRPFRR